jgi:hypothetical protein
MLLAIYKASERATYEANKQEFCAPCTYPMEKPGTGEAMRRELLMNESLFLFIHGTYL